MSVDMARGMQPGSLPFPAPGLRLRLWRFCRSKPLGAIGGLLIVAILFIAILSPIVSPYSPVELHYSNRFTAPGAKFFLGTDELGRDVLSRIIWGARVSLYVGFFSIGIGSTIGGILGLVSAYAGGRVDLLVQRLIDILMVFPALILAMAIVAAIGQSTTNVVVALAIVNIPTACRVIRSSALSIKEMQYVDAARAIGSPHWRILLFHMLPNCLAPFIIFATAGLSATIIAEASLSFLGVGTPPSTPSWGGMLSGAAQRYIQVAPWVVIFPGLALSLLVFAFNLLGDALRDALDPRLRHR